MEKQGMGGGTVPRRARLLAVCCASPRGRGRRLAALLSLVLWGAPVFSQAAPAVLGETSPASPVAGSFWTVTLLVDHPSPEQVEVRLPPLPRGLSLDRVRAEPRLVRSPADESNPGGTGRRWTALQYRFLAGSPGRIDLGPFEVLVNGRPALSPAFSVSVRSPSPQPPRIFWRNLPGSLTVGEEALLVLCISGRNPPDTSPRELSLPPVPAMSIVELLAPEGEDELLALRVIPLEGSLFTFPAFPFPLETQTLQVPALRIPVRPAAASAASAASGEGSAPEDPGPGVSPDASPDASPVLSPGPSPGVYPPFQSRPASGAGRAIQERSRALWEQGRLVEALAELRRNERDHPAGLGMRELRRDLERALGLEAEPDEVYSPRVFLVPALVLCLFLAALSLTLPAGLSREAAEKRPGLSKVWLFRGLSLFFSVAALFCLFRLNSGRRPSLNYGSGSPRQALAREAPVYRVPDDLGTEIARLKEGQGLLVYEIRDGWAYAESPASGHAGWIRTGSYLVY